MKNLLLFIFLLTFLKVQAQQNTFEFFPWDGVEHPFKSINAPLGFPVQNMDTQGHIWTYKSEFTSDGFIIINQTSGQSYNIPISHRHISGYDYSVHGIMVDEFNTKWLMVKGYNFNLSPTTVSYLIRYDASGKLSYFHHDDFIEDFSSKSNWIRFNAIGDKPFIITQNKVLWGTTPSTHVTYIELGIPLSNSISYTDKKHTIYVLHRTIEGYQSYYQIASFHSDGSYERRLKDKLIFDVKFDTSSNTLFAFALDGIYKLNGKNEEVYHYPNYAKIISADTIQAFLFTNRGYRIEGIMSTKGIIVKENDHYSSLIFAEHPDIGEKPLFFTSTYVGRSVFLQDDSTLSFLYLDNSILFKYSEKAIVFSYKNKNISNHQIINLYEFNKVQDNSSHNKIAYYINKGKSYIYSIHSKGGILQLTSGGEITHMPYILTNCHRNFVLSMYPDKDHVWFLHHSSNQSPCRIARMRHDNFFIYGKVFYDHNSNGTQDQGEPSFSDIKLIALPSGLRLIPDKDGNFAFKGEPGVSYTIKVKDSTRFSSISIDARYNIGVKLKDERPEVKTSVWLPRARCNTIVPATVTLSNVGVVHSELVRVKLIPGNNMQLLRNGSFVDTTEFYHPRILARQTATFKYDIQWPEAEQVGQIASLKVITEVFGPNGPVIVQEDSIETIIRCAYDPNDKLVSPVGVGNKGYTLHDTPLSYQIRFENTGNDTAYHVTIYDTLSTHLDPRTFELLGASHRVNAAISPQGVLVFHFNDIMLPDTNTNKEAAQGYVRFRIAPKQGLQDFTEICNGAGIVFDSNKPIITDLVCNTFVETIPVITSMKPAKGSKTAMLYPNPANGKVHFPEQVRSFTVMDVLGNELMQASTTSFEVTGLKEGIYMVKMVLKDGENVVERLVVKY